MSTIIKKPFNVGDTKQVAERNDKLDTLARAKQTEMRIILSTREGRRFYWRLIARTQFFAAGFEGSSRAYFLEGQRAIGAELYEDLHKYAFDHYLLMLTEAKEDLENDR